MSTPASSSPLAPLTGAEWLSARAALAARRVRRFALIWTAALSAAVILALLLPSTGEHTRQLEVGTLESLAAETLASGDALRSAQSDVARADSLLLALIGASEALPGAALSLAPADRMSYDSLARLASVLDAAIDRVERSPLPESWRALGEVRALRGGPRTTRLLDSLDAVVAARAALPQGPERERRFAELTTTMGEIGSAIAELAARRRAGLAQEMTAIEQRAATGGASAPAANAPLVTDTLTAREQRDSARAALERRRLRHDSLNQALLAADQRVRSPGGSGRGISPALIVAAALVLGLVVIFGLALSREVNHPTLSHHREAERAVGAPVLATVRDAPADGPARFRPTGIDPFRMLYLGLTATGTRTRTVIVTGDDPVISASVAGRLATAAAADHRATLVADLDVAQAGMARWFRERVEPGVMEGLAGVRLWREIARPVGASEGLSIEFIPAGAARDDIPPPESLGGAREEFARFRGEYDFAIIVAPRSALPLARALVDTSPIVLCGVIAETAIDDMVAEAVAIRGLGARLHGIVLWDAPRPMLPTRSELASMVTRRPATGHNRDINGTSVGR